MSFDIALSGIQAINEQLNTTSHNIANAGTYGYKSSRSNFSAIYAGTRGAGVEVGSVSQNIALAGSTVSTGNSMNAAIDGSGFFVVKDNSGVINYTRVGLFTTDASGNVIDANGRQAIGYPVQLDAGGRPISGAPPGAAGPLKVGSGNVAASATANIVYNGNLSSNWTVPANSTAFDPTDSASYNNSYSTKVVDSQGYTHNLVQYFTKTASNQVTLYYTFDGAVLGGTSPDATVLDFNNDGTLNTVDGATATNVTLPPITTTNGTNQINLNMEYKGMTQFAGDFSTKTNRPDGYEAGSLVQLELGTDGAVNAKYSNGVTVDVGRLAVANFTNADGLRAVSDTSWVETRESGTPLLNAAGDGGAPELLVARVENSNVDITSELVSLMTSQRNYQANSKVITTENQMLQSLMQAL
jgi:flagellar hook protein FlgE